MLGRLTVASKKLEHGSRMICAGFPSFFGLGLEDGPVETDIEALNQKLRILMFCVFCLAPTSAVGLTDPGASFLTLKPQGPRHSWQCGRQRVHVPQ